MTGGSIPSGENFTGDNKCSCVGTEIREKVGEADECNKASRRDCIKSEAKDAENNGQDYESTNLKFFAPNCIDEGDGQPVPWNETGKRENNVSDPQIVETLLD